MKRTWWASVESKFSWINLSPSKVGNLLDPVQKQGRPVPNERPGQRSSQAECLRDTSCTFAASAGEIHEFDLQNQFIGAGCNVKRWARLLAQQSLRTEKSQNPVRKMNVKGFRVDPQFPQWIRSRTIRITAELIGFAFLSAFC